ncbi:hypothetical protein UNDYM_5676 [Undibacterium sp. YM2]|nr:hypothetical protein UNDYM_5676 [Undibacterium sp. YM2]
MCQKGDPGVAAPTGFPFVRYKKWEDPKLAPLKQRLFFFHFLYRTNGVYTWELQKVKINCNCNHHPNSIFNPIAVDIS